MSRPPQKGSELIQEVRDEFVAYKIREYYRNNPLPRGDKFRG